MAARSLNDDESHSGGCADSLLHISDVNILLSIEDQRHFDKCIFSDPGDEADSRTQAGTTHRLIGTLTTIVDATPGSQERLAGARQAIDFHSQAGGVTTDNCDSGSGHVRISRREIGYRKR